MSQQLSCCDICKIMTWSDHCFLSNTNTNCDKIWMVRWWTVLWNVSLPCLSCYLLMDMGTSPCLSLRTWLINDWDCHLWHILLTQFNWNQCIYINWNQGTHTHTQIYIYIYIYQCVKKPSSMITNPCPNFLGCLVTEDMVLKNNHISWFKLWDLDIYPCPLSINMQHVWNPIIKKPALKYLLYVKLILLF